MNKTINHVIILLIGILIGTLINILVLKYQDILQADYDITNLYKEVPLPKEPTFIWNDDIESLPTDGSPILIEFTSRDTIYIGPYEHRQVTYKQ